MKILTIPLLAHDASICILEDNEITSYRMEERFSRNKHDFNYDHVLNDLKDTFFDKVIITHHFLDFTYSLKQVKDKLSKISIKNLLLIKKSITYTMHILDYIIQNLMKQFVFLLMHLVRY